MGAQEDVALVRRGYDAFIAGDMDTLRELFTEDAVWHTGGTGGLSGDKKGVGEILAYFGELFSRSQGTLKLTLEDVAAGGVWAGVVPLRLSASAAETSADTVDVPVPEHVRRRVADLSR